MNVIVAYFLVGLVFVGSAASAAQAVQPPAAAQSNPFDGPLNVKGAGPKIIVGGEDSNNPIMESHFIEYDMYKGMYFSYYHAQFWGINAPVPSKLPDANDAQGRPLWFDGQLGDEALQSLVDGLLSRAQFDDLDRLFNDWNNPSERMADGRPKIEAFQSAITNSLDNVEAWDRAATLIRCWRDKNKTSRAAALTEALYWLSYAWDARGHGAYDSVDQQGAALFAERLHKAGAVLLESKSFASGPLWTRIAVDVGNDLGWPKPLLLGLYAQSAADNKYNSPVYAGMVSALTPRWGGDWKLVDTFIRQAVENTQTTEATSMYARLYWDVAEIEGTQSNLFRDTLASWPTVKKGYEDMVRLYPHSALDLNQFAAAACMASDKETFQDVRFRLGKNVLPDVWPPNSSLDLCEHKFKLQAL